MSWCPSPIFVLQHASFYYYRDYRDNNNYRFIIRTGSKRRARSRPAGLIRPTSSGLRVGTKDRSSGLNDHAAAVWSGGRMVLSARLARRGYLLVVPAIHHCTEHAVRTLCTIRSVDDWFAQAIANNWKQIFMLRIVWAYRVMPAQHVYDDRVAAAVVGIFLFFFFWTPPAIVLRFRFIIVVVHVRTFTNRTCNIWYFYYFSFRHYNVRHADYKWIFVRSFRTEQRSRKYDVRLLYVIVMFIRVPLLYVGTMRVLLKSENAFMFDYRKNTTNFCI